MGVRRIFGYPGDGINGVLGGLQRAGTSPNPSGVARGRKGRLGRQL